METQEKSTLKELVGYLPYGLKFDGKRKGWVSFDGNIKTLCPVDLDGRWDVIKPILRNLYDLTKEITHNGETFVPIEKLRKDYSGFYFESNPELLIKSKNTSMYISLNWTNEFQKILYEWHFDLYNLIEKNLAIDINTLPNE